MESKKGTSELLSKRGAIFREAFLSKIVPWEKIHVSFHNFPYYIDNETKSLLVQCVASHLKHKRFRKYGCMLKHSSNRIQLQSIPGTELYRERLVSAVARGLQVPLLKLDSSVLPPYEMSQHDSAELESEEESSESESESDGDSDESESEQGSDICDDEDYSDEEDERFLKKGDRVKYVGNNIFIRELNRTLPSGNRGEVHDVNGERIGVIFNCCGLERLNAEVEEKSTETTQQERVIWLDVRDVKHEDDAQLHDCFIAMELLYEVLESRQPLLVYFPDSFFSILRKASKPDRFSFVEMAKKMFGKLSGSVILICGQNKRELGSEEIDKFPESLKQYIKSLKDARIPDRRINELFTNVMCITPPKDKYHLNVFIKQLEEDMTTVISQGNLSTMHQVLKAHRLLCMDLEQADTKDMILTRREVEKIVSWATNHYISTSHHPCVKEDFLLIPLASLKLAIWRLKQQQKSKNLFQKSVKDLAKGRYEKRLVSAVVCAGDIGVKFDDIGALEHVKKTLYETVILPLKRPALFSHGNLEKPCKGVLLFGPPGTGKTLTAKALATEAGANFINVTTATLTSMWLGETERLARALFSFARRLAPTIIFLDEVDSLLGARGHKEYNTSRLNEFMAAWDGLISKDSQRILVVGATNRPFDLDDAVLRRMPRRIYVGLPDAENRRKILNILLRKENLEPDFCVQQLAEATEGYSGDDLKNLCVAAAYRPVHEFLERESKIFLKGGKCDGSAAPRPLNINDYILSKAKVRPSVLSNSRSIKKLQVWDKKYGEGESRWCKAI